MKTLQRKIAKFLSQFAKEVGKRDEDFARIYTIETYAVCCSASLWKSPAGLPLFSFSNIVG